MKLSLVKANISGLSFALLCEYFKDSRTLKELDISHNDIRAGQMWEFINILKYDRRLVNLNISWNSIQNHELNKFDENYK